MIYLVQYTVREQGHNPYTCVLTACRTQEAAKQYLRKRSGVLDLVFAEWGKYLISETVGDRYYSIEPLDFIED